jgi:hypothetical protein
MNTLVPVRVVGSKWLRGGRDGGGRFAASMLRDKNGHMCCLGFCASVAGYSEEQLLNRMSPSDLIEATGLVLPELGKMVMRPSSWCYTSTPVTNAGSTCKAMSANDEKSDRFSDEESRIESDEVRIATLTPILQSLGFDPTWALDE